MSKIFFFVLLLGVAVAFPSFSRDGHDRGEALQVPSRRKSCGPAPIPWECSRDTALNALANEHMLPHNGRNITSEMAVEAVEKGLNFDGSILVDFGFIAAALDQCAYLTGVESCTAFDLDMLDIPHAAEHDGSLSRKDYNYGQNNNHVFSRDIWGEVMHLWAKYNASTIDFSLAQTARVMRFARANATDLPGWFKAVPQQSLGETAFYMSVFGDPVAGNARKDWVHYFFSKERLPYDLGWNATQRQFITAPLLLTMMQKLATANVVAW